jgi:hypothetical protein
MPHYVTARPICPAVGEFDIGPSTLLPGSLAKPRVRLVVLTRTRSASTTFIQLLGEHPEVSAAYEVWNVDDVRFRMVLGAPNASAPVPNHSGRFFACCPMVVCGFKLMEDHMPVEWMSSTLSDGMDWPVLRDRQPPPVDAVGRWGARAARSAAADALCSSAPTSVPNIARGSGRGRRATGARLPPGMPTCW